MKHAGLIKILFTHGIFWCWNLIYLVVAVTLLLPYVLIPAVHQAWVGYAPTSYAVYSVLCILFPLACMLVAIVKFRNSPSNLIRLFCGFEIPIFFLFLLRIVLLRDMNPGLTHLFVNFLVAFCAFAYLLWHADSKSVDSLPTCWLKLGLITVILSSGVYLALLMLPFAIPLLASFIETLLSVNFWEGFLAVLSHPIALFFGILAFLTSSLFLATPFLIVYFYTKLFIEQWLGIRHFIKPKQAILFSVLLVLFNIALFIEFNQQPQVAVFAVLEDLEQAGKHPGEISDKEQARAGLLNAYLAAWRYVSPSEKSNAVQASFKAAFGSRDGFAATRAQKVFNSVAKPFLYDGGNFSNDHQKAADYYAKIFDTPIEKAEKKAILKSIKATWERERAAASLINTASEHVLLTEQHVEVTEEEGVARINIFQALENQTFDQHEVTLHFSLPEDAALTGLWLSDDIEQPKKYAYVLAPRGAAQQVYNDEVNRRVDPSLLEQVGPRQYRLRAFPVPPRHYLPIEGTSYFNKEIREWKVERLYLSFEYATLPNRNNTWPSPKLLEKRNVFWNGKTVRTLNGKTIESSNSWIPAELGFVAREYPLLEVQIGNIVLTAKANENNTEDNITADPKSKFAVIVDGSYSMHRNVSNIQASFAWLNQHKINFDAWICRELCSKSDPMPTEHRFIGNSQTLQQLQAWQVLQDSSTYDAVIVLTDSGSYELEQPLVLSGQIKNLWLVHLNDELPYAYNDQILAMLRQGSSGITPTIQGALSNFYQKQNSALESQIIAASPNYSWFVRSTTAEPVNGPKTNLQRIAARQWINFLIDSKDESSTEVLDELHQLASEHSIVTDYSSMIVLVNDRQKEALKKAEAANDRYEREVEDGVENFSNPNELFSVASVPEPEEWVLLFIVAIMLLTAYMRRRQNIMEVKSSRV